MNTIRNYWRAFDRVQRVLLTIGAAWVVFLAVTLSGESLIAFLPLVFLFLMTCVQDVDISGQREEINRLRAELLRR